jgi:hypothetical protein
MATSKQKILRYDEGGMNNGRASLDAEVFWCQASFIGMTVEPAIF